MMTPPLKKKNKVDLKRANYKADLSHDTDIPAGFRPSQNSNRAKFSLQFLLQPLGVSLSLRMAEALSLSPSGAPLLLNSHLHIIYTPSFENGSFLKIHLDYQTLKVTSPELSVWLGGWLQTAEQCSRLDINAWLGCAGRREEPALCSLLQPIIFYVCLFSQQQERI